MYPISSFWPGRFLISPIFANPVPNKRNFASYNMSDIKNTSYPKEKINILLLENISDRAVAFFEQSGYHSVRKLSGALSEDQLIKEVKDVHLLGIRSKTQVTARVLEAASKLQAIGCFCIGVNQVDLKTATQKGVVVFNAPYSNTRSVAELVIASSIMLIRRITDKNISAHKGIWMKESKGSYELRGKTLGIIGYGNIGSQVSVLAEALGMKVIFYDVVTKLPLGNAIRKQSLEDLMAEADVITLHVPETKATKNLINEKTLGYCKKGSIILNYARGEVVDLDALRSFLDKGIVSGAAIDVYPWEPEKNGDSFNTPLQGCPNVILTPHIGGSTEEAQENIGDDVSHKLFHYLETGVTIGSHTVPPLSLPPLDNTHRILHIHRNVPGVLSAINTQLSNHNINILAQNLKTNDEIGYVVLDVDKKLSKQAVGLLKEVKDTIKVRLLY
jgi:D-3-phosphoglycerate dehydrogenase / 2-oxoglutarate reductase